MENPKLFISYAWGSTEHEEWVLKLATELRENGVDVILDKWYLKEGHDATAFMEKMVSDPEIKKVIMVCDKVYVDKANGRSGGVGTETQIISNEVYQKVTQDKFVAVIKEKDELNKPCVPVYYKGHIYIDMSTDELYEGNFEQLLRWVYDKPMYVIPELGRPPVFLGEENSISLQTAYLFRRTIDTMRNGRAFASATIKEYLSLFSDNLEKFRIVERQGEFDDLVVKNIENFLPYRNEFIEFIYTVSMYKKDEETIRTVHGFFEELLPYTRRPENVGTWREPDVDNLRFIIHELFLYSIAILIKYQCFQLATYLLNTKYYIGNNSEKLISFKFFRPYLESLEYRNKRLNLRRISVHSDFLKERNKGVSLIKLDDLMQADFVLYLRDCIDSIPKGNMIIWYPYTLLYKGEWSPPFEIFLRAESKKYFDEIKCILNISTPKDLEILSEAIRTGKIRQLQFDHHFVDPIHLINFNKLATTD